MYKGNGIDRIDNNLGYTVQNSISCCKKCNYAKHKMSYDEFIELVTNIYNNCAEDSKNFRTVYTCGVDYQHEICEAPDLEGKMPAFSTIENLKKSKSCWEECGILELELKPVKWVEPQNLFGKSEEEKND